MAAHFLNVYNSSRVSRMKRLTAYVPFYVKRYAQRSKDGHDVIAERSPSTEDEFERVAEEKTRQAGASRTADKGRTAPEDATVGDGDFDTTKERYKEPPGKENSERTSDKG